MLEQEPLWQEFLDWVEESRSDSASQCESARDMIDVRQAQGRTQVLSEILEHARQARTLLDARNA